MKKILVVGAIFCGALLGQTASAGTEDAAIRPVLNAMSPLYLPVLEQMEVDRGVKFSDSELRDPVNSPLKSPEFADRYRLALQGFCKKPESANNMACSPESR
jgi:hypothetical protein